MSTINDPDQQNALITPFPPQWNLADLQRHLGNVSAERISLTPSIGYATDRDVEKFQVHEGRLFELEYGVLVEKAMGWYESILAVLISYEIRKYLDENDIGQVLGADGMLQILPGVVKIPDVSFISWSRFPVERLPRSPIPSLVPNLVVEVLSESNTQEEMESKLHCYFEAGVELVWYVNPSSRSAIAYTSLLAAVEIGIDQNLSGGSVLPGFELLLRKLFEKADRQASNGQDT